MRLHILSDLHLEFAPFQPPDTGADVIILAGDVHPGKQGLAWILKTFPRTPVLYVLGNHEFYGQTIPKLTRQLKEAAQGTQVHPLENDRIEIGGVIFLGATLWTDFALNGNRMQAELTAASGMTDFRRVRLEPSYRRFRPSDARGLHAQSRAWLEAQTQAAPSRKVVVITHHAPSPRSLGGTASEDSLNPAYATNLEPFIAGSGVRLWVHGHIHRRSDYSVASTRVVANPRGYPDERNTGFDPGFTIEI